jgi:putative SOS response-associated peptidase YedK
MRGRYRRTTSEEEIARQYHIPIPPQLDLPISYNIAPTQNVLATRRTLRPASEPWTRFGGV